MSISGLEFEQSIGQLPQEAGFSTFTEINQKSRELIRVISSISTSIFLLPLDRVIAQRTVGKTITRESLMDIAKKPFLGAAPRLMNAFLGSFLTFGGSAALQAPLQQRYPHSPFAVSALALACGSLIDRVVTTPLGTLTLRMQTQDKTLREALRETIKSGRPLRSLYAGTSAMMLRDILYLPICIPLAEKLQQKSSNPVASTMAFVTSGTISSFLSYPFQYIGTVQKDSSTLVSARKVLTKTFQEHGLFGVYRGFGMMTGRMALYNGLFGAAISLGERIIKS